MGRKGGGQIRMLRITSLLFERLPESPGMMGQHKREGKILDALHWFTLGGRTDRIAEEKRFLLGINLLLIP